MEVAKLELVSGNGVGSVSGTELAKETPKALETPRTVCCVRARPEEPRFREKIAFGLRASISLELFERGFRGESRDRTLVSGASS